MSRRTREQWQAIIDEQQISGLSIAEYCQQHQINTQSFYARRSALKKQKPSAIVAQPTGFIKVASTSPNHTPAPDAIYIKTQQATIQLPTNTSPQWFGQFMREWSA